MQQEFSAKIQESGVQSGIDTTHIISELQEATNPLKQMEIGLPILLDFLAIPYEVDKLIDYTTDEAGEKVPSLSQGYLQDKINLLREELNVNSTDLPKNDAIAKVATKLYNELASITPVIHPEESRALLKYNSYTYLRDLADALREPVNTELDNEVIKFVNKNIGKGWFRTYALRVGVEKKDVVDLLKKYIGATVEAELSDTELSTRILEEVINGSKVWVYLSKLIFVLGGRDSIYEKAYEQIEHDNNTRMYGRPKSFGFSNLIAH